MNWQLKRLHASLGISPSYASTRGLVPQREARRLVRIGKTDEGRTILLTPRAAMAWRRLQAAAAREDVLLLPVSGFRSVQRQAKIIRDKLAAGEPIDVILRVMIAPGFSEHHTARALDIGAPGFTELTEDFAGTPAFHWLRRHAGEFGFHLSYPRNNPHGIAYEPWHWCWRR